MSMPQLQSTPVPAHAASPIRRWWLRRGFLLVVAIVVLQALVVPASEASAANVEWTVINVNSGKCLDVVGASTADQANVQQFTCHGGNNQKWRL